MQFRHQTSVCGFPFSCYLFIFSVVLQLTSLADDLCSLPLLSLCTFCVTKTLITLHMERHSITQSFCKKYHGTNSRNKSTKAEMCLDMIVNDERNISMHDDFGRQLIWATWALVDLLQQQQKKAIQSHDRLFSGVPPAATIFHMSSCLPSYRSLYIYNTLDWPVVKGLMLFQYFNDFSGIKTTLMFVGLMLVYLGYPSIITYGIGEQRKFMLTVM